MRRKYNDLLAKRAGMLTEAEGLFKEGKREDYRSKMTEIENLNSEITEVKTFIDTKKLETFLEAPTEYGKPWFGQLMAGPQLLAYFIQINYWMQKYHLNL